MANVQNGIAQYPKGFTSGVTVRGLPILNSYSGNVWYVDSNGAQIGDGKFNRPFAAIDTAINHASAGDIIVVKAGHTETLVAAGAITLDVAGLSVVGEGTGNNRPKLTFTPLAVGTAPVSWTAANVSFENIVCIAGLDAMTTPFAISGANAHLDIEWQDGSNAIEAATVVQTTTAADNIKINLRYVGFTDGNACVSPIKLNGATGARINVDFYGLASTAIVEFADTLSTDVLVTGYAYNSTDTTGALLVVDTVGSSLWYASIYAGAAGALYKGGSAAAMAGDPSISAVTDALYGANGVASFPAAAAAGNAVSIAEVLRYVSDNVINGTGTALDTNTSLYGVLAGATGIPTFPASALPANNVSIAEVLRETYDQADKAATNAAATLVNNTTIFTIAGGPIEILSLVARCVTTNDATASTLQWNADPTDGIAVTFSAASASLGDVAAGGMVVLQGTTLATAPLVSASGVNIAQQVTNGIVVGAGVIKTVVGTGSTTGTWMHHLRYRPLSRGVTVTGSA
ncbi:MAG: hypothetical protein NUW01_08425 [Gemmatimonadaceae bacterium]|nr:hypothetical protein [Gemmatimonadaceae bacterium]